MYVSVTIQTYTDIALQFCGTGQNELILITKSTAIFLQKKGRGAEEERKETRKTERADSTAFSLSGSFF